MAIVLEKATLNDAAALEKLSRTTFTATFGHLYSTENLEKHLQKTCSSVFFKEKLAEGNAIIVARDGANLVGYIKYGYLGLPLEKTGAGHEIHRLYVLDAYQRSGLGKRLMEAALDDPILKGAPNIFLGVWENNKKALAFYARYEFTPHSEYTYFVGTHADREIILKRAQKVA